MRYHADRHEFQPPGECCMPQPSLILSLIGASLGAACSALAQPPDHPVEASLVAEYKALSPGTINTIGVLFEVDDGWHLYWNGLNDSGFAPEIRLSLPEGYQAGEVQWPAPKRKITAETILDHIYTGSLLLMIPIEVPADAKPGATIRIEAEVDWLVCEDACIPGAAELSLALPVAAADGEEPAISEFAALFRATRGRLAKPLPRDNPPIIITRDADSFIIASQIGAAQRMAFYPAEESATPANLIDDGEAKGEAARRLIIRLAKPEDQSPLIGIVELWSTSDVSPESTIWWIDSSTTEDARPSDD
jgi:DsbC/DsbD-like thiol-disulfide interchange protein